MCRNCVQDIADQRAERARVWRLPLDLRPVPYCSGEAAIYSPEYLARREGNSLGALPVSWRYRVL